MKPPTLNAMVTRSTFALLSMAAGLVVCFAVAVQPAVAGPPNVVVILADDLGFSDVGCYGGEIDTPHLDRLAAEGLRFTQGYNTARCWPTRAALLTGYYPQAIRRDALPGDKEGQQGSRPAWARLLPELLAPAGYRSYHSGKWHLDGEPRRQGFARSLRVEGGQNDFFDPAGITIDGEPIVAGDDFYVTTAIGDHAAACLQSHAADHATEPFFLYAAFTSPHFPLQAPQELIAKYKPRYVAGWDEVRQKRFARLGPTGIPAATLPPRETSVGPPYSFPNAIRQLGAGEVDRPLPWAELDGTQREFQATKMAIHAAMVELMDRAIGRILAELERTGALDNTLILFCSDNGSSAEIMIRGKGHDPALPLGSSGTYLCLGPGWSTAANTPFRRHKTWVHEGGIATPWIVHWPRGIADGGEVRRQPVHVIDVVPTVLELAGLSAAAEHNEQPVPPMHGRSFAPALAAAAAPAAHEQLWWCHEGHRAIRAGDWKLVADKGGAWELYDLAHDRTESLDRAATEPARVAALAAAWKTTAADCRRLAADKLPATSEIQPPLSTRGRLIVDRTGGPAVIRGVTWFGLETPAHAPGGLWLRSYGEVLAQIRQVGFNLVRIPFSIQGLRADTVGSIDYALPGNESLRGMTPLQLLDELVAEAGRQGLLVLLDCQRWNDDRIPELWHGDGYSEEDWLDTWSLLAARYRDQPHVIGADIKNEPHGRASWGTGDEATDFRLAAERCGNRILSIAPDWLIVVQGIEKNVPGQQLSGHWWGGNLEGVRQHPVRLERPGRVVYSPHEYGTGVYDADWFHDPAFPRNLRPRWKGGFHYIATELDLPVLVGEFGGRETGSDSPEGIWQREFVAFLAEHSLGFIYWSWNPESHDTGGLVQADWRTLEADKFDLLELLLEPRSVILPSGR